MGDLRSVATSNRITDAEHSTDFGTSKQGDHACSNNCLAFEMNDLLCGEVWDSNDAKSAVARCGKFSP